MCNNSVRQIQVYSRSDDGSRRVNRGQGPDSDFNMARRTQRLRFFWSNESVASRQQDTEH